MVIGTYKTRLLPPFDSEARSTQISGTLSGREFLEERFVVVFHATTTSMNTKRILNEIRDELDSRQIKVQLEATPFGVIVKSSDYASILIAKSELRRRNMLVLE